MSYQSRTSYKRYLQPGSEIPIPSSTWFRYKKMCKLDISKDTRITFNEKQEEIHDVESMEEFCKDELFSANHEHDDIIDKNCDNDLVPGASEFETKISSDLQTAESIDMFDKIQSLLEDSDEDEDYNPPYCESDTNYDFFMDALEDNNFESTECFESEDKTRFSTLEDMISSDKIKKPLNMTVQKSQG